MGSYYKKPAGIGFSVLKEAHENAVVVSFWAKDHKMHSEHLKMFGIEARVMVYTDWDSDGVFRVDSVGVRWDLRDLDIMPMSGTELQAYFKYIETVKGQVEKLKAKVSGFTEEQFTEWVDSEEDPVHHMFEEDYT